PEYYQHIWVSWRRVSIAFLLATATGVPLGLFLGWSLRFKEYVFPVFELLRPIPPLAWVPLAIIMFQGSETPIVFLTFLASFYATTLNTMLGVESIDVSFVRAAYCLGARRRQVFWHVIVPGAMPFIFTGLQISVGVAWFSLVAGEMVSGQYGLGYLINTSYTMVQYPTMVIGMITLGVVGYVTSAAVRIFGNYLMQWRAREVALGGEKGNARRCPRVTVPAPPRKRRYPHRQSATRARSGSPMSSRFTVRKRPVSVRWTIARSTFLPERLRS